jgi:hypothetical protein
MAKFANILKLFQEFLPETHLAANGEKCGLSLAQQVDDAVDRPPGR